MHLTIYSFINFSTAALILTAMLIIASRGNLIRSTRHFLVFCGSMLIWQLFYGLAYAVPDYSFAVFLLKIGYTGVIIIPAALLSFAFALLKKKIVGKIEAAAYSISIIFVFCLWMTNFFLTGAYIYYWGSYPKAGLIHPFFVLFMCLSFSISILFLFIDAYKIKSQYVNFQQLRYVAWSLIFGVFGSVDFIANYGIEFYPFGALFISILLSIVAYTIVKYRLMDVSLVLTRTSIFIAVYSLVLGIPFALAFGFQDQLRITLGEIWWIAPLVTSTVLATAGPFIYLFIQKRAEARLFQEQVRYQTTLRQASLGMGRIKDLKRLVTLIVHIVTRTVRLEHSMIYLNDPRGKRFVLGAVRSRKVRFTPMESLEYNSPLISELDSAKLPIVYTEIQQQTQDHGDHNLARLEKNLRELEAALVVPSFVDEKLMGIIILGKKISGKMYSNDDLAVFSILANQAALAIENAQFYDDMKMTHEQLFKAEKMATIGTMADGLSHQINNRLHALGFIAGDALDTVRMKKNSPMSPEIQEVMVDIEHALVRIQENVVQGGEIVQGLLKYTRKGEEGYAAVELDRLIDAAVEMTQFKVKHGEMRISREFKTGLPQIKGNFTQLQEVFFNLIDNAYDAMMQKKHELKDPAFAPMIRIFAESRKPGILEIIVEDNGIGVKDDDKEKLFTPFFTTKLSSKKGTGLGLYVIRKLIEDNHGGKVSYVSRYMQGTRVYITLPTADSGT